MLKIVSSFFFSFFLLAHLVYLRPLNIYASNNPCIRLYNLGMPKSSIDDSYLHADTNLNALENCYSSTATVYKSKYFTSLALLNGIKHCNMYMVSTHGSGGGGLSNILGITNTGVHSQLWSTAALDSTNNHHLGNCTASDLADLKFAYFNSCYSYYMGSTVMGIKTGNCVCIVTTEEVWSSISDYIEIEFNYAFRYGSNVQSALSAAQAAGYSEYGYHEGVSGNTALYNFGNPYYTYSALCASL